MQHTIKFFQSQILNYSLNISIFLISFLGFNSAVIAQNSTENMGTKNAQNILKYVITKNTKDTQLESIKENLTEQKITIEFKDLKRNDLKEITSVRIDYDSEKGSGEFFSNSDHPIKDIAISYNVNEKVLTVGQATKNLSQSFEIVKEDGEKKIKTSQSNSNVLVQTMDKVSSQSTDSVSVVGKDGEDYQVKKERNVYVIKSGSTKTSIDDDETVFLKKSKTDTIWIKENVKNIIWTNDDGSDVEIIVTENDNNNIKIFDNGGENPLILADGKEINKKDLLALKPEVFESVTVIKGDKATEKYGKKGEFGVIEIILKKN